MGWSGGEVGWSGGGVGFGSGGREMLWHKTTNRVGGGRTKREEEEIDFTIISLFNKNRKHATASFFPPFFFFFSLSFLFCFSFGYILWAEYFVVKAAYTQFGLFWKLNTDLLAVSLSLSLSLSLTLPVCVCVWGGGGEGWWGGVVVCICFNGFYFVSFLTLDREKKMQMAPYIPSLPLFQANVFWYSTKNDFSMKKSANYTIYSVATYCSVATCKCLSS